MKIKTKARLVRLFVLAILTVFAVSALSVAAFALKTYNASKSNTGDCDFPACKTKKEAPLPDQTTHAVNALENRGVINAVENANEHSGGTELPGEASQNAVDAMKESGASGERKFEELRSI